MYVPLKDLLPMAQHRGKLTMYMSSRSADESYGHIRRFWPVIPLFALFALFMMYAYQFDLVASFLQRFLTSSQLAQIGMHLTTQACCHSANVLRTLLVSACQKTMFTRYSKCCISTRGCNVDRLRCRAVQSRCAPRVPSRRDVGDLVHGASAQDVWRDVL